MSSRPLISVCILASHALDRFESCLDSLHNQISAPEFELLVGGNVSVDVLSTLHRYFPKAEICETGLRLPGAARNPLVERARGDLLLFLDDDVTAPPTLLASLADTAARHPEASVFGGPNVTPPRSPEFQVVQGAVLSSLIGAGPVSRRYGARHPGPADERWFTLCNLAVRREAMTPFPGDVVCAEENAVLTELRSRGEHMHYEPTLQVFHSRRATPRSFAKQMFKYGRGRGELLRRDLSTFRAAYFAPSALLLYLAVLPVLLALGVRTPFVLAPAALYLALSIASGIWIGWTIDDVSRSPLAAALIVMVHACYGAGLLRGLFSSRARAILAMRTSTTTIRWATPEEHLMAHSQAQTERSI